MTRLACATATVCLLFVTSAAGIDLDVTSADMEAVLAIARGSEDRRAAFHRPYTFPLNHATVERLEVITERRRLMLLAEARIAAGDHLFSHGLLHARDALRPWRQRVSIVAYVRFHPQNTYIMAPPVDIVLIGPTGERPALNVRIQTEFALPAGRPNERLPVVGATAEAVFDAVLIGQSLHLAVVRLDDKESVSVPIHFDRLP